MNEPSNLNDYIECAIWASTHYDEENGDCPLDQMDAELSSEARADMANELSQFMAEVDEIRESRDWEEFPDPAQIAHDFWLTRNRHGAGFWDRGLGELGDLLTKAAHDWGSSDLYIGDDGKIYVQ